MKKVYWILSVLIPGLVYFGNEFIDLYQKFDLLKEESIAQKNEIIKRNEIINRYYNDQNELIEEKTNCETTQKVIQQKARKEIDFLNEVADQYDYLVDSLVEVIEFRTENIEPMTKIRLYP